MNKPIIGINPYYFNYKSDWWLATKEDYIKAVYRAGGIPVTLHHPQFGESVGELVERVNGIMMVGGPDFHCNMYGGGDPDLLREIIHPNRESFDRNLFNEARRQNKPILAICAGFQHINLIYNGTLYEDIEKQTDDPIDHGLLANDYVNHSVILDPDSNLYTVMGEKEPEVRSTHHQGIKEIGENLRAVARSSDGLIEAVEDAYNSRAFIAVQWHPELYPESSANSRIFDWLISESQMD